MKVKFSEMDVDKNKQKFILFFFPEHMLITVQLLKLITTYSNSCAGENRDHQVFDNVCHLHCRHRCAFQLLNPTTSFMCNSPVLG